MKRVSGPGGLPGSQRVKADNSSVQDDDEVRITRVYRVMKELCEFGKDLSKRRVVGG